MAITSACVISADFADDDHAPQWELMNMTDEEKREILSCYLTGFVTHSYVVYSVINALSEKGLVDPSRIIAWAETFASQFDQDSRHEENADIADKLRQFAKTLRLMRTPPERSGTAQGRLC